MRDALQKTKNMDKNWIIREGGFDYDLQKISEYAAFRFRAGYDASACAGRR